MGTHQEPSSTTLNQTSPPLSALALAANSSAHITLVQELMRDPVAREGFDRLYTDLPSGLYYHSVHHTLDVFEHVLLLGRQSGLDAGDLRLLAIAAAWHDTGFIEARHHNEPIAARWAQESMERAGSFSPTEIADVHAAILDTEMKLELHTGIRIQRAVGRLSPWLLDADLSNFGRTSFFHGTLKLYRELYGAELTTPDDVRHQSVVGFLQGTLQMLKRHSWQTDAACQLFQEQKRLNMANLSSLIDSALSEASAKREEAWFALKGQS